MLPRLHCERLHADLRPGAATGETPPLVRTLDPPLVEKPPPLFHLLPLHCWFSLRPGSPSKSFSSDALIKGFGISALLFVPSPRA